MHGETVELHNGHLQTGGTHRYHPVIYGHEKIQHQRSECHLSVPISNAEPTDDLFSQTFCERYSCGSYRVSRDPTGCEVIPKY